MSRPRDDRQDNLFQPSLETIINPRHPLVRLAGEMDWDFVGRRFGSVCRVGPGQPPLPTRLVAGLFIIKHMHNLSDEALCDRWVENPYYQYFCGEVVFRHELPFDRSSLTRWRQRLGEEQLAALLQESLAAPPEASVVKRYLTVRMRAPRRSPACWRALYATMSSGSDAMLVVVVTP